MAENEALVADLAVLRQQLEEYQAIKPATQEDFQVKEQTLTMLKDRIQELEEQLEGAKTGAAILKEKEDSSEEEEEKSATEDPAGPAAQETAEDSNGAQVTDRLKEDTPHAQQEAKSDTQELQESSGATKSTDPEPRTESTPQESAESLQEESVSQDDQGAHDVDSEERDKNVVSAQVEDKVKASHQPEAESDPTSSIHTELEAQSSAEQEDQEVRTEDEVSGLAGEFSYSPSDSFDSASVSQQEDVPREAATQLEEPDTQTEGSPLVQDAGVKEQDKDDIISDLKAQVGNTMVCRGLFVVTDLNLQAFSKLVNFFPKDMNRLSYSLHELMIVTYV